MDDALLTSTFYLDAFLPAPGSWFDRLTTNGRGLTMSGGLTTNGGTHQER